MSELPSEDEFRACLGDEFEVVRESGDRAALVLDEVTPGADRGDDAPADVRRRPFSLVFRGDPALGLDQRIHRLHHERLGDLDVFLVPIQPDARGSLYEAVFG